MALGHCVTDTMAEMPRGAIGAKAKLALHEAPIRLLALQRIAKAMSQVLIGKWLSSRIVFTVAVSCSEHPLHL